MSELERIIAQGEGVQLDFKFRIDDKQKIARTLAAFANTEGGTLLIGVKDNGKIKGVNPEEEYYMVEAAAGQFCDPPVVFESKVWQEGHHLVLSVEVRKSDVKHRARDEDGKWRYYVRVHDHTLLGNKILERIWRLQQHGQQRPTEFDERTSELLRVIRERGTVSISALYRSVPLRMKDVDAILSSLVFWGAVAMHMSESGTTYALPE